MTMDLYYVISDFSRFPGEFAVVSFSYPLTRFVFEDFVRDLQSLSNKLWFIIIERDIKKVSVYGLEILVDGKSKRGNVQVNGPSTQA